MIYLSICIPTYNRSEYLCDTIESIISQPEFTESDEVEIIISDNCSSDDTELAVKKYIERYPEKIKYNRNTENIRDLNYEKVLSMASGAMLKLHNDTLNLNPEVLGRLLNVIKRNLDNDTIPFFVNGRIEDLNDPVICCSAAEFIQVVSHFSTWIASFCISKKQFLRMNDFSARVDIFITQVYVLMKLLSEGNQIEVVPDIFFTSIIPQKKGGFSLSEVFLSGYFEILSPYFITDKEKAVLKEEKRKMLYNFFLPYWINIRIDEFGGTNSLVFDTSNFKSVISNEFTKSDYARFLLLLNVITLYRKAKIIAKRVLK